MRILLIGDQSIQNDALTSILNSEDDWEIERITHDQFQDGISSDRKYQISLIDFISSPYNPDEYMRDIREKKIAEYFVALCEDRFKELNESLIEAGANLCFSIDSETDELLQIVSQLNEK